MKAVFKEFSPEPFINRRLLYLKLKTAEYFGVEHWQKQMVIDRSGHIHIGRIFVSLVPKSAHLNKQNQP